MPSMKTAALAMAGVTAATCLTSTGVASAQRADAPARPAAPQAAALPPGYQLVTLPNANVPNFQRRTLYCPHGKRVLGGGAEARGNQAILVGSFPTADGRGWIGIGRQINHSSVGISVFAICAH